MPRCFNGPWNDATPRLARHQIAELTTVHVPYSRVLLEIPDKRVPVEILRARRTATGLELGQSQGDRECNRWAYCGAYQGSDEIRPAGLEIRLHLGETRDKPTGSEGRERTLDRDQEEQKIKRVESTEVGPAEVRHSEYHQEHQARDEP